MNRRTTRIGAIIATVLCIGLALASCGIGDKYATSTSDTHVCVFDGSERGGQKLKFQVPPGAESKKIDNNDQVIKIPASNRFFMATTNRAVSQDGKTWVFTPSTNKDPLAPPYYESFAKGSVKVQIEGQVRFRFNLKLACEWYSKHGRRNADSEGDLGFNARGDEALSAGWFKFLSENFGITMQEVATEDNHYAWPAEVFNYPQNADESGVVPPGKEASEATNIALGIQLGKDFTKRLNANLGGDYFCGIDTSSGDDCPPMQFQVITVHTADPTLEAGRQELEKRRQDLRSQELEGKLLEQQQASVIATQRAEQATLRAKLETAQIQAQIDAAKCLAIVAANPRLDCDGKQPAVIVGSN